MTRLERHALQIGSLAAITAALRFSGLAHALDGDSVFEQAVKAYASGGFAIAEAGLQSAAREGHPQAHEILGLMYAIGAPVYPGIEANRTKAARHLETSAALGSPSSRYLLCALNRYRGTTQSESGT